MDLLYLRQSVPIASSLRVTLLKALVASPSMCIIEYSVCPHCKFPQAFNVLSMVQECHLHRETYASPMALMQGYHDQLNIDESRMGEPEWRWLGPLTFMQRRGDRWNFWPGRGCVEWRAIEGPKSCGCR